MVYEMSDAIIHTKINSLSKWFNGHANRIGRTARKRKEKQPITSYMLSSNNCPNENEKKNKQKFCDESDKWNAISSISDDDSMLRLTE